MAIQMRRGEYDDFDASKMLAGELAVVVSGDPETEGGALYVATAAGSATRVAFANEIPGDATTTSDGLMSAADKAKLDGVAAGAQANVIESVSVNGNNATVTGKAAAVTIPEATDSASGVMGAQDKTKLDGIAEGANKVNVSEDTRGSGAKVVSFSVQNPDGTYEVTPTAVKADSNGYVDMTSVANGSIPNSKLATPYELPTMSASAKGGATVGDGLAMTGDALGIADEGVGMGMLSQEVQEAIEAGGDSKLSATSESIIGTTDTAQWTTRESAGSGAATVRSVQGNAVTYNQYADPVCEHASSIVRVSATANGTLTTLTTTNSTSAKWVDYVFPAGHKVLLVGDYTAPASNALYYGQYKDSNYVSRTKIEAGETASVRQIYTITEEYDAVRVANFTTTTESGVSATIDKLQVFDLTQMFGAGNEPSTVAEFEAMYPEAYYPYSAPTLKPVQIAGIQSVGFNQWDEEWETGSIDTSTGANANASSRVRSKGYIPVLPNTAYNTVNVNEVFFYDSSKGYLSYVSVYQSHVVTAPSEARYARFRTDTAYGPTYKNDICINISNPALNGQYKPYMADSVEWTAQTLRAAGSVRDELTESAVIVRTASVTLDGSDDENWGSAAIGSGYRFSYKLNDALQADAPNRITATCDILDLLLSGGTGVEGANGFNVSNQSYFIIAINQIAPNVTTVSELRTWLSTHPITLYYALATPTTTPISPALPMTYRVERGGTESIIVPAGEISATPVLTVAEGESAADVVMDALACIATPDGPVATSNHAVGTYLTYNGKLYKVTSAIAVGETITAGTNVTATTVMDEILALN